MADLGFWAIAADDPGHLALVEADGRETSAGDLLAGGNQVARGLQAMGLEMDGKGIGFGTRSQRYSAIIENGVIKALNVEKPMKFECSTADAILDQL